MNKNTIEFVPVSDEQLIQNPELFMNLVPFSHSYQCCHLRPNKEMTTRKQEPQQRYSVGSA